MAATGAALAAMTGTAAFAIVGGSTVQQAPSWMGSVQDANGNHVCGASLVDPTWAVTAKHCLKDRPSQVRFGSADYAKGGDLVKVADTVEGPKGSDTALLKLARPATGTPIPLASSAPAPGTRTTLLGWGQTYPGWAQTTPEPWDSATAPRLLKQLPTTIAPAGKCSGGDFNPAYDLCPTTTQTLCNGDSTGPADVVMMSGQLVGVTSRGAGDACGSGGAIYASVPAVAPWIQQTIATGTTSPTPSTEDGSPSPSTSPSTVGGPSTEDGSPSTSTVGGPSSQDGSPGTDDGVEAGDPGPLLGASTARSTPSADGQPD